MEIPELNPHSAQFKQRRIESDFKPFLKDLSADELVTIYRFCRNSQSSGKFLVNAFYDLDLQTWATQCKSEMRRRIDGHTLFTFSPLKEFMPKGVIKRNS